MVLGLQFLTGACYLRRYVQGLPHEELRGFLVSRPKHCAWATLGTTREWTFLPFNRGEDQQRLASGKTAHQPAGQRGLDEDQKEAQGLLGGFHLAYGFYNIGVVQSQDASISAILGPGCSRRLPENVQQLPFCLGSVKRIENAISQRFLRKLQLLGILQQIQMR